MLIRPFALVVVAVVITAVGCSSARVPAEAVGDHASAVPATPATTTVSATRPDVHATTQLDPKGAKPAEVAKAAETSPPRRLGTAATFPHFRVTVGNTVWTQAHGLLVYAQVCVRSLPPGSPGGKTRISWTPWTVVTTKGSYPAHLYDGSHPPENMFPSDRRYAKGDCGFGFVPFSTATGTLTGVRYHNGVGDSANWSLPVKATRALGTTKKFDHLSVTATSVKHLYAWYGATVKVCATSLPTGATSITVRTDWTMSTNTGVLTGVIMQEGAPEFGTDFPQSVKLTLGKCASGWVSFPLTCYYTSAVHATQVNYRDLSNRTVSFAVGS